MRPVETGPNTASSSLVGGHGSRGRARGEISASCGANALLWR